MLSNAKVTTMVVILITPYSTFVAQRKKEREREREIESGLE